MSIFVCICMILAYLAIVFHDDFNVSKRAGKFILAIGVWLMVTSGVIYLLNHIKELG